MFANKDIKEQINRIEKGVNMNVRTFVISDLHFNHLNIIKYCDRPFNSVDEMNKHMIKIWNENIKATDIVYFLGDFCMGGAEQIQLFAKQLNGRKRIVLGNHDRSPQLYLDAGFEDAYRHPIIVDKFYILSHKTVFLNDSMPYVNIHGHTHDTDVILMADGKNMYFNVCVEKLNYTPINFDKIKEYYLK